MTSEHQTVDHTNKIMGVRLDIFTGVGTTLASKITRQHLLSGLPTSFLWYECITGMMLQGEISYEISWAHMKHTTIHRQNHLVLLLHLSVQLHFHTLCRTWWVWSFWKQQCPSSTISLHVIPRHYVLIPDRPALYTTADSLFPVLLSSSRIATCVRRCLLWIVKARA